MIEANKDHLRVRGDNGDVLFELDEIIKYAIDHQPEMLQSIIIHRGSDLLRADVDPTIYNMYDHLIDIKMALESEDDYDDDEL